jgi:gliding motility-associated-like protein
MHTIRIIIYLLFSLSSYYLNAQVVSTWHQYKKNKQSPGWLNTASTIVDKKGDYYVIITTPTTGGTIDSAGHTVTIDSVGPLGSCTTLANSGWIQQIVVIKYTKDNQYLYHLRFYGVICNPNGASSSSYTNHISRNIDSANNLVLTFIDAPTNFYLYNTNGSLYQDMVVNKTNNSLCIFNISINENGGYNWINYLNLQNWLINQTVNINYTRILDNKLLIDIHTNRSNVFLDSISVYHSQTGMSTYTYTMYGGSNSFYCNLNGSYLSTGKMYNHFPASNIRSTNSSVATDNHSIYRLVNYEGQLPDTIIYANGVKMPLDSGYNMVLEKFVNDSLCWAKKIYRYYPIFGLNFRRIHRIAYDTDLNQIITMMLFVDSNTVFYEPISKPSIVFSSIIKFDTTGNILTQTNISNNFGSGVTPSLLHYNPYKKTYGLVCTTIYGININGKEYLKDMNPRPGPYYIEFNSTDSVLSVDRVSGTDNTEGGNIFSSTLIWQNNINYSISNRNYTILPHEFDRLDSIKSKCKGYYSYIPSASGAIIINPIKMQIDTIVCNQYLSPSGKLLDSTGFYLDTFAVAGSSCVEVARINLRVRNNKNTINQTHCGPLVSPSTRFVMDTTGVYKDTLVNQSGCDSLLTINFTQLRKTDTTLRDTLVCSLFITQQGDTLRSNTNVTDTLQTTLGCDSIVRYRLIIGDSTATIDTAICNSYTSPSGNYTFTDAGTWFDTVPKPNGCRLYYTIRISKSPLTATFDTSVCNNFTAPSGKIFTAPGNYLDTIPSARGCDSIITFRITKASNLTQIDTAICNNYVSPSGKLNLNSAGIYFDTIVSTTGCDSVFEIRLSLDTFSVRISKSNDLTCETPTITLSADAGNRFIWQPAEFLNAANLQTVVATPQASMQYKLTAYNATGCEATDSITIEDKRVEITLTIPNIFTPDGDNVNEDFGVDPMEDVAEMNLQIFNRWGQLVFESNVPQQRWLGNATNGNECTAGVYYYIAKGKDRCGKSFEATGTVSLVR